MRQLQFHEYLALMDGGVKTQPIDDAVVASCRERAQLIWPHLRIGSWADRDRKIEYVGRCEASGKRLIHVSADWQDCFLILVVPDQDLTPDAYLLFDIGAEYRELRFICPTFDLDQVADEATIRRYVPQLRGRTDPFAILEKTEGTYIQTYADDDGFDVEHQLVSSSSHYALEERVNVDVVIDLFVSYAFGKNEWARKFTWRRINL